MSNKEEKNEIQKAAKVAKKAVKTFFKISAIPTLIIIILLVIFMGALYYIFRADMKDMARNAEEYYNQLKITPNGIESTSNKDNTDTNLGIAYISPKIASAGSDVIKYAASKTTILDSTIVAYGKPINKFDEEYQFIKVATRTEEEENDSEEEEKSSTTKKAEEIAKELKNLERYIKDSVFQTKEEKLEYLLNAEAVMKFPYIDSIAEDRTKLNGIIKFYRFETEEAVEDIEENKEEYRLSYVTEEEFERLKESYISSGNKDVYKYFTVDEEQNVVIACGTQTIKTISSDDGDVTLERVNNEATEEYQQKREGEYSRTEYRINTKQIPYQTLIEPYVMPFNFLASLLVQTKDYNLVRDIAKLAYDSEIAIGIYDNESRSENSNVYKYNKKIQYTANTTLDFSNVKTSNPVVDQSTLTNAPYTIIISSCVDNKGSTFGEHLTTFLNGNASITGGHIADYSRVRYVKNSEGKITELAQEEAKEFKTTHTTNIYSNSNPTIGVILADTWIAKWTVEYKKEDQEPSGSESTAELDDTELTILEGNATSDFFEGAAETEVNETLKQHSEKLKEQVIQLIMQNTDFTTNATNITVQNINKGNIIQHVYEGNCYECIDEIANSYGHVIDAITFNQYNTGNEIVNAIRNASNLAEVRGHILSELRQNAQQQATSNTQTKKNKFEQELKEQITYTQWPTVYKSEVNIVRESNNYRTSSTYKKDQTITEKNEGEAFRKIFKKTKYAKSIEALTVRGEWFWDCIKLNEDTAKIENILRYLFNKAMKTDAFGDFTAEEIEELFKAFEPREDAYSASISNLALLREYVRSWENQSVLNYINGDAEYSEYISQYISEDKTEYYIRTDGYNHPTVGFGVDIYNGGFVTDFEQAGYSMEIGTAVPVEFVDSLEERELMQNIQDVRERTSGLNLKPYQIYALVSRAYNCGIDGAMETFAALSFVEAYTEYYNTEEDDLYGKTLGDFTHELYKKYMEIPIKSNGQIVEGLRRRRESEWTLFQTGYMDRIGKLCGDGNFPDGIRTFKANGYVFPEYPQTSTVGDTSLYAGERYGDPQYGKTLGTSGCGTFSLAVVLSGLLNDSSIDPITVRDTIEKEFGYSYYIYDPEKGGSSHCIYNDDFLYKYYGVHSKDCNSYQEGIKALEEGKCIIGYDKGHLLAIVPVPEEYKSRGYKFFVIDSARGETGAYSSEGDFLARTGETVFGFNYIISL